MNALEAFGPLASPPLAVASDLPFLGGWFMYLGYEMAWHLEPGLGNCTADPWLPDALLTYFPTAIIRDHQTQTTYLVDEENNSERMRQVITDIRQLAEFSGKMADGNLGGIAAQPLPDLPRYTLHEDNETTYRDAVARVLQYIREGDCFQANLSRAWHITADAPFSGRALYERLRQGNPAPFSAWLRLPGGEIFSSSPERLVRVAAGQAETRPIAGTRRRDDDQGQDLSLRDQLHQDSKEIAEHIMLVDLERNDLGRVAIPGSVHVAELMRLESYRRVHHTVSVITADLRPEMTAADIVRAVFPGGTITGCPKIRSMQIIQELEQDIPRGAYTGSCGYLSRHGVMDTNILIRTWVMRSNQLRFRTGAGIVADSNPQLELEETRHKARALLEALA